MINLLQSLAFLATLAAIGSQAVALLKLRQKSVALEIGVGFLLLIFTLRAFQFFDLPLDLATIFVWVAAPVLLLGGCWAEGSKVFLKKIFLILVSVSFCSLSVHYVSQGADLFSLGNNDIFNWYSAAAHLSNKGNFYNLHPDAYISEVTLFDGLGTLYFLNLFGAINNELILSSHGALVALLAWLGLACASQTEEVLGTGPLSFSCAVIFTALSPVLLYVVGHGFFAHLLGTIAGALLVDACLKNEGRNNPPIAESLFIFFVPVALLLATYQSGFLIFFGICAGELVLLRGFKALWRRKLPVRALPLYLMSGFSPLFAATASAALLLPDLAMHTWTRTKEVAAIDAGWGIPLWLPHAVATHPSAKLIAAVLYALVTVAILAALQRYLWIQRNRGAFYMRAIPSAIWFCVLAIVFFVWYSLDVSVYQNWKFATFALGSMGFIIAVPFTVLISQLFSRDFSKGRISSVCTLCFFVASLLLSIGMLMVFRHNSVGWDYHATEMTKLKKYLKNGDSLVIALAPYAETMLAMQLLSQAKLYPTSKNYYGQISADEIAILDSPKMLRRKEDHDCQSRFEFRSLVSTDLYEIGELEKITLPYSYSFKRSCLPG